jgi:hypothetical protein
LNLARLAQRYESAKKTSTLARSDGNSASSWNATRAQSGLCRPIRVSLRACQLHVPCAMHMGCTCPAGSSRLASGKAAADGMCVHVTMVIVRSDRGHSPEWLPRAACSNAPGASCISADPRAPGCRGDRGTTGTVESRWALQGCAANVQTGRGLGSPAARAASCSAADGRRTVLVRQVHRLDHACPFACDRSPTGICHLSSRSYIGLPSAYASVRCLRLRRCLRDALHWLACPCWPSLN